MKKWIVGLTAGMLAASAIAQQTLTAGEVTKLDKTGGRITLKHGEIKNLDMPPMSMTFHVASPKLLDGVTVGDRVHFAAERLNGQFTVTVLNKAR